MKVVEDKASQDKERFREEVEAMKRRLEEVIDGKRGEEEDAKRKGRQADFDAGVPYAREHWGLLGRGRVPQVGLGARGYLQPALGGRSSKVAAGARTW